MFVMSHILMCVPVSGVIVPRILLPAAAAGKSWADFSGGNAGRPKAYPILT
jgi:hypothetical protein